MDAYHVLERIGEGSFGKVFKGRRKVCINNSIVNMNVV